MWDWAGVGWILVMGGSNKKYTTTQLGKGDRGKV